MLDLWVIALRRHARFGLLTAAVLLAACQGREPPAAGLRQPLPVLVYDGVELIAPPQRRVPIKVFMPDEAGTYPLIVLSHGTFSNRHRYDPIAEFWAGQGYIVMLPQHIDADNGVRPTGPEMMQDVVRLRVDDMRLVLDSLQAIQLQLPDPQIRVEPEQYVAAGHSIGTQAAMIVTGARFQTAFSDRPLRSKETRYRALVLISDPGKMRLMPPETWLASTVPTFMATGTDDYGLMGSREPATEPQTELLSLGLAPGVLRAELLLEGGDHYFGGLVQKELEAEPDLEGLEIFNRLSTVFLHAVMKQDAAALSLLVTMDLQRETGGRATLTLPTE